MKKRLLATLLVLMMVVSIVPLAVSAEEVDSGTCGDNLTWVLDSEGTLTISGTGEMNDRPWSEYSSQIKTVVIEDGVTSIGLSVFQGCTSLTSVTIPDSVTDISWYAFQDCTSLTSVTIPDSVTEIGRSAFAGCASLTSVTIPSGVTFIDDFAFSGCTSLTAITVDSDNANYSSQDGILFNKEMTSLILCPAGKAGAYVIPSSVTYIEGYAFAGCVGLTSVTIPDSVTEMGWFTFADCTSLNKVTFEGDAPESLSSCAGMFRDVTATVYYPAGNETWTEDVMQDYSGDITWVAYSGSEPIVNTGDVTTNTSGTVSSSVTVDTSALLTEDDAMLIIEGYDVEIVLSVDEITSTVSSADSALILSAAGEDVTAVSYLDIDLTKYIYDTYENTIYDTEALTGVLGVPVTITVAVPQSLLDAVGTTSGTYSVVRIHDGAATVLATTYDSTAQTVTFTTDRFSTYGIVFTSDTSATDPTTEPTTEATTGSGDDSDLDDVPQTGDSSLILVGMALLLVALPILKKFAF